MWGSWRGAGPPTQLSLHRHPQLPALLLLQVTGTQAGVWLLRAHLFLLFHCKDAAAKDGAHGSQPALTNDAAVGAGSRRDLGSSADWPLLCSLTPRSGCSGLWSFTCAASGFGEGLRRKNWLYFLRTIWDPREVPKLNLTGQNQAGCGNPVNPGGRRAALVGLLLELGSVRGLGEKPGLLDLCRGLVGPGGGARMGPSLKEGC